MQFSDDGPGAGERPDDSRFLQQFFDLAKLPLTYDWKIEPSARVYANRNLKMDEIGAIGFDMDYTLAIYLKREIEELAFRLALDKLVADRGYPELVRGVRYDPNGIIRGVVADRKLGNFLKMDQFHVVTAAMHGSRMLDEAERRELYHNRKIRLGQERYFSADTLFALPECALYQRFVDFADANPEVLAPDYLKLYDDVRAALDVVHRDNSLKSRILAEPDKYIDRDPRLPATLDKFLKGGKKLFVVTNSEWHYTDAVMTFLLDGQIEYLPHWTDYFELIVVESSKPRFFLESIPLLPVEEARQCIAIRPGKVFRKGSVAALDELLGVRSEGVLFVGDHIYGDILRSKKQCGWRTVMIVEEMELELKANKSARHMLEQAERLRRRIERMDFKRNLLHMKIAMMEQSRARQGAGPEVEEELARQQAELLELDEEIASMNLDLADMEAALERRYNPIWGPLFRAGGEISRFGQQVQAYACLYTGRVSNFLAYPFNKFFRSPRDLMPHDLQDGPAQLLTP
jgi:HAD superfamily 5'-nucleotidase-like hydrolase